MAFWKKECWKQFSSCKSFSSLQRPHMHITYKSIIQLASQKKFWHKHGMSKKNFSIFKDWYRETIFIGNEVKSSIFQLRVHAVLLSHHLLVLKSIIHQSLSCIPNSLILVEKKPLGRSNTLKRKLVCNAFPLVVVKVKHLMIFDWGVETPW